MEDYSLKIDWDKFAKRVQVGAQVKSDKSHIYGIKHEDIGILLENYPYRIVEIDSMRYEYLDVENLLYFQPFRHIGQMAEHAQDLRYFIDNRWQTFDEVMS